MRVGINLARQRANLLWQLREKKAAGINISTRDAAGSAWHRLHPLFPLVFFVGQREAEVR